MKVLGHTVISLATGSILYNHGHSFDGFLWFLIAGIFIDIDHYIDYVRERGISFDFRKVYKACKYGYMDFKKITFILHSYELLILLWLVVFLFNLNIVWRYAAIGFTLHLFFDQICNPIFPFTYFLWFRITNNFETEKLFTNKGVNYAHRYR